MRGPSGTLTFLFSDIEGSSQRWEGHPEAMRTAVAQHDAIMRRAIEEHRGHVFKTVGDAFCCAFSSPHEALDAAIAAQSALQEADFSSVEGIRARMALHTGCADERDGDYFGPAVNRVARLMSIGAGGQLLVSGATHELLLANGGNVAFTDLGLHRLKDLTQPERVFQASTAGLQAQFPPLRSLDAVPNNLPVQVTSFCGREQDVEDLKAQLSDHRLVTLFGAGGVGKTRLALQVAAESLDRYGDGVWVADFSPINDPELVPGVVARALGMSQQQGQRVADLLPQWLREKTLLLILDSCEHVLDTVAPLTDAIHHRCPNVRILATSRQALDLSGEKVLRVASLAVPATAAGLTAAAALQFGAINLFVDRATLVNQSFHLHDDNATVVAAICQRLDGIPLAIELAAARVKVLGVNDLAHRLNERFKLLSGGSRSALPRQKTLAALIDWSYDLLTPAERVLFSRLAVFAGNFSLDAATDVCSGGTVAESDVFELATSLADKSLLVVDTSCETCYRLLESTRDYALQKLRTAEQYDALARRHADCFLRTAKGAEAGFGKAPLSQWLAGLEPNVENFRAALDWAITKGGEPALGGEIALALEMFWWHGDLEAEGRRWIDAALAQASETEDPEVVARLRKVRALLLSRMLYS
ncbi:MAG: adenylate/guanylate cyclase domain-containing protein [Candidatus Eremiobacteraeota bacterium]|nr:adenylate/guanylate cyclase domain-containing protein [Candidatus Eremiobacteraeota bacterium]